MAMKTSSSASLRANIPSSSSHHPHDSKLYSICLLRLEKKHKRLALWAPAKGRGRVAWTIRSVLGNRKSSGVNDNGATEPTRLLLERLFEQTQKLEEHMSGGLRFARDVHLGLSLENLESDLQAALEALKRKEDDLADAERIVLLEHSELNRAREELDRREREIAAFCSKQEKLEEDLERANLNLSSQSRQIEELKLQLRERDQDIASTKYSLSVKEDELGEMRKELMKRNEEAARIKSELDSKAHLLNEANGIIRKQELEILQLQKATEEKKIELEMSYTRQKLEEKKLKEAESNLEKRTMEYLLTQEELKTLTEAASKNMIESNATFEDFRRVRKLLADVRCELVSSQESLASSRKKMEDLEKLLERQFQEVEEQRTSVMSYMVSLNDAQVEVESERGKLRVAEAHNKELEWDLSLEKELTDELQEDLKKERESMQQAIQERFSLQEELNKRSNELGHNRNLLQVKESELVEAKLEIQHLKSKQASLQLILNEKDAELIIAREKLGQMNQEVTELKMLLNSKEDQLIQASNILKEKEEQVQMMQDELHDTKLKFSETENVVQRIVDLTNKLVSVNDEDYAILGEHAGSQLLERLVEQSSQDFKWEQKQLKSELELTRENLRMKEMSVLAAQRALSLKDQELQVVLGRLEEREEEIRRMKNEMLEDSNDLRKLYALAQERIGEKSIGDLAIEKLQLEAAQLEVEAATCALHKLTEMSRELLAKATISMDADSYTSIVPQIEVDAMMYRSDNHESITEVTAEVVRLSALTEHLLREADITA